LPAPDSIPVATWLLAAIVAVAAISVYAQVALRIATEGGKVRTGELALPELLMSIVFASFFGMTMIAAIRRRDQGEALVSIDAVLPNSLLFIAFTIGIAGFIRYRGLRLTHVFGIDQVTPLATLGWACGLLFAALPIAGAANALTVLALKNHVSPQPLVELFSNVSRQHDYLSVTKIFVSGVLIQPACEEFLFRGFFYGVWKRYLGALPGGFLSCLLFAAFHTSLTALAGLFVLAVCLNLAYERTGSLLVPIGMHALFNFVSLLFLYTQAQFPPLE
jgi:hypothetical protein